MKDASVRHRLLPIAGKACLTALLVYLLVFLAFAVLPLDPARSLLGPVADAHAVAELNRQFGFDGPILTRLARVTGHLLQGDFGESLVFNRPAVPLVIGALGMTMARLTIAVPVGFALAWWLVPSFVVSGSRVGRWVIVAAAGVPSFVFLALLLMVFGAVLEIPPSQSPIFYGGLAVFVAAIVVFATVALTLLEQLDFRENPSRQAEFLQMLHAPPERLVRILLRGALPTALAAMANSVTSALTALTFAEFVFGLPGFAVMFMRACDHGDMAIVAFGSLVLAVILVFVQSLANLVSANADRRLV